MEVVKKRRKSSHQTQWAAQFGVASELCKRGYEVAITLGNHPSVDLIAISSRSRTTVLVDAKGLQTKNAWPVTPKAELDNLFYIFAFVPTDARTRYFVVPQATVNALVKENYEAAIESMRNKGKKISDKYVKGFRWDKVSNFEDAWDLLPK